MVFEGWDASGKGGCIQRLTAPLDPRHVRVKSYAAPTYDEKRHHFLWRFWPALPGWGGMAVLDRSWYGRVLVERVEGFATEEQWQRAYGEICDFEGTLVAEGMILVKFWLHLAEEEQLNRFERRAGPAQEVEAHATTTGATGTGARRTRRRSRTCWPAPTSARAVVSGGGRQQAVGPGEGRGDRRRGDRGRAARARPPGAGAAARPGPPAAEVSGGTVGPAVSSPAPGEQLRVGVVQLHHGAEDRYEPAGRSA